MKPFRVPDPTESRKRGNKKIQLAALAKRLAEKLKKQKQNSNLNE